MTADSRFGAQFGVTQHDWPGQPDEHGIRHLHLSMRRPGDRSAYWLYTAVSLLGLLALGLFIVQFTSLYLLIFSARHETLPSAIEALALDVAMTVFSMLALALAWRGQSARTERVLVIVCALGSAAMCYAAANGGSPRSVAVYVMPSLLLAVAVDRLVAVVRRFVAGDTGTSAWSGTGKVALYTLRFFLALRSTSSGLRRQVLIMTPLPDATSQNVTVKNIKAAIPAQGQLRTGSKKAVFLKRVVDSYGPLAQIDLSQVSQIASALAPAVDYDTGSARRELGDAVKAAQIGHLS